MASCSNCVFFEKAEEKGTQVYGFCLRYPPVAVSGGSMCAPWPIVNSTSYCGEWQKQPKQPAPSIQDMM